MADLEIRAFRPADEPEVVQLWGGVFPNPAPRNEPLREIQRKLTVQPELFLVALSCAEVVGTVMAGYDGNRGWIHRLAVSPAFRGGGIGRALMVEAERRLAGYGCLKVNLQVVGSNDGVVAFYEKLGYRVEDRISMGRLLESGS